MSLENSPKSPDSNTLTVHSVLQRHPDVSLMRMADEGLLVVPRAAEQIVLNDLGTRLLEELDGTRTLAQIAEALADEYDAPAVVIGRDLVELVADLFERGAVVSAA